MRKVEEAELGMNKGFTEFHRRRFYNTCVKLRLEHDDLQLLDLRLCDLPLRIRGSPLNNVESFTGSSKRGFIISPNSGWVEDGSHRTA
jgi:hypothetical protein